MAWDRILAGIAGGLSSGLGQVQDQLNTRKKNEQIDRAALLDEYRLRQAAEAQALAEAQAQLASIEDGVELGLDDPMVQNITKRLGVGAFVKGPSGKGLMRKPKPQNVQAELALEEFKAEAPLRAGERDVKIRTLADRNAFNTQMTAKFGSDWTQKIFDKKVALPLRQQAGLQWKGDKEAFMFPEEVAAGSASVMAAGINAAALAPLRQGQAADININNIQAEEAQFQSWLKDPVGKLIYFQAQGKTPQEKMQAARQIWMSQRAATPTITSIQEVK